MALKSGTYIISSVSAESYIGRNLTEDLSLNPKRVIVLPKGVEAATWDIEALPEDNYILSTRRGFAAEIDKLLFAVIVDEPPKVLWKIIPQKQHGEDTYIIVLAECPSDGWIAPQDKPEEEQQIAVKTLIAGKSLPPFYPPTELFRVIPLVA